jgi:hypothetical protein
LALRKRLKASWTSAGVHGFGFADFFAVGLGDALAGFLAVVFFAAFFGKDGTLDFLVRFARMILAMIRVY